jgi:transcriptional regulator with XRE-family HTH domain
MTNDTQALPALQQKLGQYVRRLRLAQNMTVQQVAATTELAEKSVRNLESGKGSTTETLFKVLSAVGAKRVLGVLAPSELVSSVPARTRASSPRPAAPVAAS